MSGGPSVVFDKSFLQGLNVEEAGWFDNLFTTIITPLFFVETLADLEKEEAKGRTPEEIVGSIAVKTPVVSSAPTIHHLELCMAELLGHQVERGRPYARAKWVKTGTKVGTRIDNPPEMEAFERWNNGEFLSVEHGVIVKCCGSAGHDQAASLGLVSVSMLFGENSLILQNSSLITS
jgi:hypothetical protein